MPHRTGRSGVLMAPVLAVITEGTRSGVRLRGPPGRWPEDPGERGGLACHPRARAGPAEHAQHAGKLRVGPAQAGLDAAEPALLVVAEAPRVLPCWGLLRGRFRREAGPRSGGPVRARPRPGPAPGPRPEGCPPDLVPRQ